MAVFPWTVVLWSSSKDRLALTFVNTVSGGIGSRFANSLLNITRGSEFESKHVLLLAY